MSDGWTDGKNCTIINFLVSCPQGTMFLKSVDASDKVKDAHLLLIWGSIGCALATKIGGETKAHEISKTHKWFGEIPPGQRDINN